MQSFPEKESTFLLPGPAGELEVLAANVEAANDITPIAIICHPHPLHSGTMNNKVVTTLARTFKDLNLRTVRFNFRGVGKSTGTYDQGVGECDDLITIINWVKQLFPQAPIWLAGFSFGSYIAAKVSTQIQIAQLVCVAPPVINFKMENLPPITCPWVIVQGDQDEIVSAGAVFAWAESVVHKPVIIRMPGAGHFFHGQLLELRDRLERSLQIK